MKVDLDELERKVQAATQDEWQWRPTDVDVLEGKHDAQVVLFPDLSGAPGIDTAVIVASTTDRAYIAAASPPVVLALIARIRELEATLTELVDVVEDEYGSGLTAKERALLAKGAVLP